MTTRGLRCGLLACVCVAHRQLCAPLASAASLRSGDAEAVVDAKSIVIRRHGRPIVQIDAVEFNDMSARRWEVLRADSRQIVLAGRFPASAFFFSRAEDSDDRLVELTVSREPGGFRIYASPAWAHQVTLRLKYLGDHFFGLSEPLQPDNRLSPDLTGSSISVDLVSEGESLHENYASAFSSFYMSSFGYGAFFDSFARGRYDFAINGANRVHHDGGTLDWHIFIGDDGRDIHRAYFELIGKPKPVPAWGLGPMGWRDQNDGGAAEMLDDISRMTQLKIPFTSWMVDRPYSDGAHGWSQLNFSQAFARPAEWIGKIRNQYGLEFVTWATPATFGDTRFGRHLAGKFTYLDLSDADTVRAYQDELRIKQHLAGVKGHKIDRADEGFPVAEDWADESVTLPERRNRYTYLMAKIHDESLRATWGDDQMTFTRAAIQRAQPYLSAIWAGDPRANWEGLRGNFANAARSAFMGFPVWGSDVGGYQGEGHIPVDLYVRWLQAGSMSGLFEIKLDGAGGEGRDRLPWRYDERFQQIFRAICEQRMQFIPYLYSLSHTSADTGTLMQPLAYRHPGDANTWDIWDEFYLGYAILVAPVFGPGNRRRVYLPQGEWYDYDDPSRRFAGGKTIEVDAPLEKLPRFVKENSLYVTGNLYRGNDRIWGNASKELVIHATPGRKDATARFDYVDMLDGNRSKAMQITRRGKQVTVAGPTLTYAARVEVRLSSKPKQVSLGGAAVAVDYDAAKALLRVPVAAGQPIDVAVTL
jgi:alpha-glucosidase (family GH31 glycosyl hydrolase)